MLIIVARIDYSVTPEEERTPGPTPTSASHLRSIDEVVSRETLASPAQLKMFEIPGEDALTHGLERRETNSLEPNDRSDQLAAFQKLLAREERRLKRRRRFLVLLFLVFLGIAGWWVNQQMHKPIDDSLIPLTPQVTMNPRLPHAYEIVPIPADQAAWYLCGPSKPRCLDKVNWRKNQLLSGYPDLQAVGQRLARKESRAPSLVATFALPPGGSCDGRARVDSIVTKDRKTTIKASWPKATITSLCQTKPAAVYVIYLDQPVRKNIAFDVRVR